VAVLLLGSVSKVAVGLLLARISKVEVVLLGSISKVAIVVEVVVQNHSKTVKEMLKLRESKIIRPISMQIRQAINLRL
jgi:hypothetical protein